MWLLGCISTFLVFQVATLLYVWAQAVVGRSFGATVERIAVGIGPIIWSRRHGGTEWCLLALPLGGHTKFYGDDEEDGSQPDKLRFTETTVLGRALVMIVGPISNGLLGMLFLLVPVLMQGRQLVSYSPVATQLRPSGVPGLGLSEEKSTVVGQYRVFDESFVEYFRALHFAGSDDWGGPVTFVITCGVAAHSDIYAWVSCTGILLVGIMVFNLVPMPVLNGGHLLILFFESVGCKLSPAVLGKLHIAGLFVVLPMWSLLFYRDYRWISAHLGDLF